MPPPRVLYVLKSNFGQSELSLITIVSWILRLCTELKSIGSMKVKFPANESQITNLINIEISPGRFWSLGQLYCDLDAIAVHLEWLKDG